MMILSYRFVNDRPRKFEESRNKIEIISRDPFPARGKNEWEE